MWRAWTGQLLVSRSAFRGSEQTDFQAEEQVVERWGDAGLEVSAPYPNEFQTHPKPLLYDVGHCRAVATRATTTI